MNNQNDQFMNSLNARFNNQDTMKNNLPPANNNNPMNNAPTNNIEVPNNAQMPLEINDSIEHYNKLQPETSVETVSTSNSDGNIQNTIEQQMGLSNEMTLPNTTMNNQESTKQTSNSFFNQEISMPRSKTKESKEKKSKVKIKRFNYKVKEPNGEIITSYFDAEKEVDVQAFLLAKNYEIISITLDKLSTALGLPEMAASTKMNSKDLNFFLTQLSTYVKSGIPLVDSMEIMSRQTKKKNLKDLYRKIVFELNRGTTFSVCLEKQGKTFPKMLINMLKTSEMTGDLTGVLDDMAKYYKQQDTNRKQIINAMTYPSVLMIFAVTILVFVMTYVVPSFTDMYAEAGAELPAITKVIIDISDFLTNYWYYVLAAIILVALIIAMLFKSSKSSKYAMQWLLMHVPVVKDMIKYNQLVTFTGTFATLIKHDVFITDSMSILGKITENEIYKGIINSAINHLSKGDGVSIAFKGHWAFPETAYEMLVTGEKTGKLGEMLQHVTDYYQEEQTSLVTRLKSLIEPMMIILLAVIVGVVLLAVILPMFSFYGEIV